jgi:hypothetical protein
MTTKATRNARNARVGRRQEKSVPVNKAREIDIIRKQIERETKLKDMRRQQAQGRPAWTRSSPAFERVARRKDGYSGFSCNEDPGRKLQFAWTA